MMRQIVIRFIRLFFGLFLYALGIVITVQASIGYAPWDVFHSGLSNVTGMSFGMATIVVGLTVGAAALLLGEKLGVGSVLNLVLIGIIIDLIIYVGIIPKASGFYAGIAMLVGGLFVIAAATYYYISTGFGTGPRDGLMVALRRKTGLPVGVCRSVIELCALMAGWLMGGMAGLGTVISMLAVGACVQLTFRLFNFKPETVSHETIPETLNAISHAVREKRKDAGETEEGAEESERV